MIRRLRRVRSFKTVQWVVLLALILVLAFTGYQATQAVRRILLWHKPQEVVIRGWMNLDYIARTQGVPRRILNQAIGLPPDAKDSRPLSRIAREQNRTDDELDVAISTAIAKYRSAEAVPGGED